MHFGGLLDQQYFETCWNTMTHLVNKWNDKTNTFQFDSFEITMTLEDVARITGLKCDGSAVLLRHSNYNAREKCTALLGMSMDE